jgi:nickel transport protein
MKAAYSFIFVLILAMTAIHLEAHGIWFAQRSGELAMIYGEGAEDDDIVKRSSSVKSVAAYDDAGAVVATKLMPTDRLLLVDVQHKPAVITAVLDNGIWTVGADNVEVQKAKSEVPNAKESGHYFKYAVHLRGDLKTPLGALPGQTLQLTPVDAVLPKRRGDPIKLRVLYQGKPVAGAAVLADFVNDPDGTPLRTDKTGIVTLKIRNQGLNVVSAVHDAPTDNPAATDKVQHRATLSFVLAPKG